MAVENMIKNSYSSDEEEALLLLLCEESSPKKRLWVRNNRREENSEYHKLCRELESYEDRFFCYFHMSRYSFEQLHDLLEPHICKLDTNYRKAIETRERLMICLRYIRTGDSLSTISSSFRLGRSTVSAIIEEVSKAIWNILQPLYMPNPTEETWRESELGYREIWNFPNCVGSIDGKHVKIKCPNNSASDFSIVLLAITDPFYKFTMVDVGSYGRHGDSNIFENSEFYRHYLERKTVLPPKPLPGTTEPIPHVLIGDEGFKLQSYLMRPFNRFISDPRKRTYNNRLCHARRIVEKTFGILTATWGLFHRPLRCNVEKAIDVTKAACCLHNYVIIKDGIKAQGVPDGATTTHSQKSSRSKSALLIFRRTNARSSNNAIKIREKFVTYFNN